MEKENLDSFFEADDQDDIGLEDADVLDEEKEEEKKEGEEEDDDIEEDTDDEESEGEE